MIYTGRKKAGMFRRPAFATSSDTQPMAAKAWDTMPMPVVSEPCLTSIITSEVITTVDMNFGR